MDIISVNEVISMTVNEATRQRIFQLCEERNISVNKMCTMSGITQSTINNIVNNRNKGTTVSTVKKICDGLEITMEEFFHSELFDNLEQEIK